MAYCLIDDVRERLPDVEGPEWDTELGHCIEQAESIIDDMLRPYTTVPLTGTISDSVKYGTADIAAAIFRSRRTPDGKMPTLYDEGVKRIQGHIKSTYRAGTFVR